MKAMIDLPLKNKPRSRSLIIALLVLAVLLPLWWQTGLWYRERLLNEMRVRITGLVTVHANLLSAAINQRLSLLKGLRTFADMHVASTAEIDRAKFTAFAVGLSSGVTGIRSFAIAPGGTTLFIYPAEGSETLVGQDLIHDRRAPVRTDVQRAIRTRRVVLSGPYALRQKGLQLVARQAVYRGETFWGLVSVDCDVSALFAEAALDPPPAGLDLILQDRTHYLLTGNKAVLERNPIAGRVELPDGPWKLSALPAGGWNAAVENSLLPFRAITLALALLLTYLVYLLTSYRARLKQTVQERTGDLQRSLTSHREEEETLNRTLGTLRRSMAAMLEVLARAVEMKDPYATGHQRRVADLARTIAMEMGHPEAVIDGIRMAGVVHDIGKLLLPAEILNKPARLTEAEFTQIKKHPQAGHDVLKDIAFPWPIARMVWQHHERFDGSGYPLGLAGEEILPEARILAVADVVESMASHRAYRPAPGLEKALEEIQAQRGFLFDPAVVDACIRIFKEKDFRLA
jgi:HD-GYP domain-containing protein (c-di-GMP phosphodiesterase class II)